MAEGQALRLELPRIKKENYGEKLKVEEQHLTHGHNEEKVQIFLGSNL